MFDGASISLAPLIPLPVLLALAALAAVLVLFGLVRRARGSVLRAFAFAALLAALANPSWVQERREPLSDVAQPVAVDVGPGSAVVAVGRDDGAVDLWDVRAETLVRLACETANRNLTPEEWTGLVGRASDYRETCPEAAA